MRFRNSTVASSWMVQPGQIVRGSWPSSDTWKNILALKEYGGIKTISSWSWMKYRFERRFENSIERCPMKSITGRSLTSIVIISAMQVNHRAITVKLWRQIDVKISRSSHQVRIISVMGMIYLTLGYDVNTLIFKNPEIIIIFYEHSSLIYRRKLKQLGNENVVIVWKVSHLEIQI